MTYKVGANTVIEGSNGHFTNLRWDTYLGVYYNLAAQGINYGYAHGGYNNPLSNKNEIERWPFAAETTNAADVGNLTAPEYGPAGVSSETYGYRAGGATAPFPDATNVIDRYPFASATTNATDVGDMSESKNYQAGQQSTTEGYVSGGWKPSGGPGPDTNVIEKWPFSAETTNTTDVGDLSGARQWPCGQSSDTYGYSSGGAPYTNIIERFPFASGGNAVDVGDLTVSRGYAGGNNSKDYGYINMGYVFPPVQNLNTIDRYPFAASTTNATDVGDATVAGEFNSGTSSSDFGYSAGYATFTAPATYAYFNNIHRFPFANPTTNAVDVGDLVVTRGQTGGTQF